MLSPLDIIRPHGDISPCRGTIIRMSSMPMIIAGSQLCRPKKHRLIYQMRSSHLLTTHFANTFHSTILSQSATNQNNTIAIMINQNLFIYLTCSVAVMAKPFPDPTRTIAAFLASCPLQATRVARPARHLSACPVHVTCPKGFLVAA